MKYIANKNTGKIYGSVILLDLSEDEVEITGVDFSNFIEPYYNFETNSVYEGNIQNVEVPFEVQRWRIKRIIDIMGLTDIIEGALNALPEPTKGDALAVWKDGTTIERTSQTVLFLQYVLQMTDNEVDKIFIDAEAIKV